MNEKLEIMTKEIKSLITLIKNEIKIYEEAPAPQKEEILSSIKSKHTKLEDKFSDLQNFLVYNKISEDDTTADLEDEIYDIAEKLKTLENALFNNEPQNELNGANQEIMNQANNLMEEAENLGKNMKDNVKKGIDMMHAIEEEVYEQRLKLLRTRDNLAQAQNYANRGKELVGYFSGQMAKDKCMKVMIGIMAVLLVGSIVGLFMLKNQMKINEKNRKEALLEEYGDIKEQDVKDEFKGLKKHDTEVLEGMEEKEEEMDEILEKKKKKENKEEKKEGKEDKEEKKEGKEDKEDKKKKKKKEDKEEKTIKKKDDKDRRRQLNLKDFRVKKNIFGIIFDGGMKNKSFDSNLILGKFRFVKKNRRKLLNRKVKKNNYFQKNLNNKILLDTNEDDIPERNLYLDLKKEVVIKKHNNKVKKLDLDKNFLDIVDHYAVKKNRHSKHKENNMHIY